MSRLRQHLACDVLGTHGLARSLSSKGFQRVLSISISAPTCRESYQFTVPTDTRTDTDFFQPSSLAARPKATPWGGRGATLAQGIGRTPAGEPSRRMFARIETRLSCIATLFWALPVPFGRRSAPPFFPMVEPTLPVEPTPSAPLSEAEKTWTKRSWKWLQSLPIALWVALIQIAWAGFLFFLQHRFEERQDINNKAFEARLQQSQQAFEIRQRELQQSFEFRQKQLSREQARIDEKIRLRSRFDYLLMTTSNYREREGASHFLMAVALSTRDAEMTDLSEKNAHELSDKALIHYAEIVELLSRAQLYFTPQTQDAMNRFRKNMAFNPIEYSAASRQGSATFRSCVAEKLTLEQCLQRIERLIPKEKTARYRNLGDIVLKQMAEEIGKDLGLAVEYNK